MMVIGKEQNATKPGKILIENAELGFDIAGFTSLGKTNRLIF